MLSESAVKTEARFWIGSLSHGKAALLLLERGSCSSTASSYLPDVGEGDQSRLRTVGRSDAFHFSQQSCRRLLPSHLTCDRHFLLQCMTSLCAAGAQSGLDSYRFSTDSSEKALKEQPEPQSPRAPELSEGHLDNHGLEKPVFTQCSLAIALPIQ